MVGIATVIVMTLAAVSGLAFYTNADFVTGSLGNAADVIRNTNNDPTIPEPLENPPSESQRSTIESPIVEEQPMISDSQATVVSDTESQQQETESEALPTFTTNVGSRPMISVISLENKIHQEINKQRANYGLEPLTYDFNLANVARTHSTDMAENDFFSHNNLIGENPTVRASKAGIDCRKEVGNLIYYGVAENIEYHSLYKKYRDAYDARTGIYVSRIYDWYSEGELASSIVNTLMESPHHKENILTTTATSEGIGVAITGVDGNNPLHVYTTEDFCY